MIENELPETWIVSKLGEVCFTTSGGTPSRKRDDYYGGNIPWVKSGELSKGLITKTEEYITEGAVNNSSAKIFPAGTLLIALYGATIGKSTQIDPLNPFETDPLIPFQIDPLIPAEIDPLKIG